MEAEFNPEVETSQLKPKEKKPLSVEQLAKVFYDSTKSPVGVISESGEFVGGNESFYNSFFSSDKNENIDNLNIFNFLPADLQDKIENGKCSLKDCGGPITIDYPCIYRKEENDKRTSEIKWKRWVLNPVSIENKNLYSLVGSDITEIENNKRDSLTKLFTRNEGIKTINNLDTKKPVTFGFVDINGLKETNDIFGHKKGDLLIAKVAVLLKNVFGRECVFRWGGDEFLIVIPDKEGQDFIDQITEKLKNKSEKHQVSFAVAFVSTSENFDNSIVNDEKTGGIKNNMYRRLIKEADEKMYTEKKSMRKNKKEPLSEEFSFEF